MWIAHPVMTFMRMLQFISNQLESSIRTHMSTVKEIVPSVDRLSWYSSMFGALHVNFLRWFEDFKLVKSEMHMILSPSTCI